MATSGIPGGRGPNRATEFVVPRGPFADATGGHILWPLQRVQITRAEPQPPLADHYSRLFFGRGTAVQIGQPFFSWRPIQRIDDPESISWRADHTLLHRYRAGFQTVGQPYALIWNGRPGLWFEPEIIRQPDHSALNLYRVGYQTVGQPWAIWAKYRQPDFEPEKIVSAQYDLYPYRQITITAGAGQPWYLWPPIQITIEPEEKMYRENHDLSLYPFRPHPGLVPTADQPPPIRGGVRRKRRILPDGTRIEATDLEMSQILRQFRRQRAIEAKTLPLREIAPHITVKPSVPIVLPEVLFEDTQRLKQLREEEEFILLIHESTRRSH